jgi:hypothetical protein
MLQGKLTNLMIGCAPQRVNPNRHGKLPRRRGASLILRRAGSWLSGSTHRELELEERFALL